MKANARRQLTPSNNAHWHLGANYPNETTRGVVLCFDNLRGACGSLTADVEESLRGLQLPFEHIYFISQSISQAQMRQDMLRNQGYACMAGGLIYWIQWVNLLREECPYRNGKTGEPGLVNDSRQRFADFLNQLERALGSPISTMEKRSLGDICFRARLDPASAARVIKAARSSPQGTVGIAPNQRSFR